MENKNFSHFGIKDEDQQWYIDNRGKKVEPRKQAIIDGYGFGDRLLEGVMFIITIQDDGSLKAEIHPDSAGYFEQLNKEMWLEEAIKSAMREDCFSSTDENEEVDLNLIMDNGDYNFEHERSVSESIDIQDTPITVKTNKIKLN